MGLRTSSSRLSHRFAGSLGSPLGCALLALLTLAAPQVVRANAAADVEQEGEDASMVEAARLTQLAEQHYAREEFERARALYRAAYEAYPQSALLFNVAQCSRRLGEHDVAISFYGLYLEFEPDTPHREVVESLMAESRHALAAAFAANPRRSLSGFGTAPGLEPSASVKPVAPASPSAQEDIRRDEPSPRRRRVIIAVSTVLAFGVSSAVITVATRRATSGRATEPASSLGVLTWR